MSLSKPSLDEVTRYAEACWMTPPLLVKYTAEDVIAFLDWDMSKLPNYDELQVILAETQRFPRYHKYNKGIKMHYQDYVWVHQERMHALVSLFQKELQEMWIDTRVLLFLCRYHDSPEWVSLFGDIPTPVKEKFDNDIESTHIIYEQAIIKALSERILLGHIEWFSEEEIQSYLSLCVEKKEKIWQLLSYFDKLDAMMISFHEVMSWNKNFFSKKLKWYNKFLRSVHTWDKLPLIQDLISQISPWSHLNSLFSPEIWKQMSQAKKQRNWAHFHEGDLHESYWVPAYLLWKIATMRINTTLVGQEEMSWNQILIKQR